MRGRPTTKGNMVKELLTRFPESASNALAKKLHKEHPLLFLSKEAARTIIRYYRGQKGEDLRGRIKDKTHFKTYKYVDYETARQRSYTKK